MQQPKNTSMFAAVQVYGCLCLCLCYWTFIELCEYLSFTVPNKGWLIYANSFGWREHQAVFYSLIFKVLWSFRKCKQLHQIKVSTCKQQILGAKGLRPALLVKVILRSLSLTLPPKRVTLRSVMKREHLCLKCSSIIHPLWRTGTWANKELPLCHIHQNLDSTFTRWECETERREESERRKGNIVWELQMCQSSVLLKQN